MELYTIKKILIIFVIMLLPNVARANAVEKNGIYYNLTTQDKVAEVTSNPNKYTGTIIIPESFTYEGVEYCVTSIGSGAFRGCSGLTSVTIPKSVTTIWNSSFWDCNDLISIVVEKGNLVFDSREECNAVIVTATNTLKCGCKNTTIPSSVTSIGLGAFYNCNSLTSITIPNSVTSIGDQAFGYCSSLTSVSVPNSVTSIGSSAFYGCSGLTSVSIGNSVTSIGDGAFYDCSGLTSVHITDLEAWCNIFFDEDSPLDYAYHLFLNGSEVTELVIPSSITSIGSGAFEGCSSITSVFIPNSVTSIGNHAFERCSNLTSVSIGNSVSYIGDGAFHFCKALTSLIIGNNVTTIGDGAFSSCRSLATITIPNSVTSIGDNAFVETDWYKNQSNGILYLDNWILGYKGKSPTGELTLEKETKGIANYAFFDCRDLISVTIPDNVTVIGDWAFCNSGLTSVSIPNSVTSISDNVFASCSDLTSVTIPNSVTSIGDGAFRECNSLATITIPNSVTSIGSDAFYDTGWYQNQPNGVLYLDNCLLGNKGDRPVGSYAIKEGTRLLAEWAFPHCNALTSITIPNSVTNIGSCAFYGCRGLTSVRIPYSVKSIGQMAFSGCSSLTTITSEIIDPFAISDDVFSIYKTSTLIIPVGKYSSYQSTAGWKQFLNIREKITGDVNLDGEVNKDDLDALVAYIMGETPEGFYMPQSNLNGDEKVDVADVVMLIEFMNSGD